MISPRGLRILTIGGAGVLAAGVASRWLLVGDLNAVVEATGIGLLLLGAGMILVARAAEGGPLPVPGWFMLLPLIAVWAARSLDSIAVKRAIDVWAACAAGFAVRDLVLHRGLGPAVRATMATAAVALAIFGIAQTLYLRREVAAIAHELQHDMSMSELGRAFLASSRAAATFVSPNAFGGFLLLAATPLVAAATARPSPLRLVLAAITLGGFACAGSAGSAMAAVLGACIVGANAATGGRRGAWLAGLAAAVVAAIILLVVAAGSEHASGKLRTLQERIDYQKQGFRLLREHWIAGAGLEQTGKLVGGVREPGEASSRLLHDWWLQGLVEAGIAFVPIAILLAWAIIRAARAMKVHAPPTSPPHHALVRPWRRGLFVGAAIALGAAPFVTVLPYELGHPLLHGVVMLGIAVVLWRAVERAELDGPGAATGAAAGLAAFGLHGLIDFDAYVPGVMLTFALALALLPSRGQPHAAPAPSAAARTITGIFGFVTLIAPIGVLLFAQTREHVH